MRQLVMDLAPDLSEIRRVSAELGPFMDDLALSEERRFALELVLDELLTNTITYGFRDQCGAGITVSVSSDGDRLRVQIVNDAIPFDPLTAPPPDLDSELDDRRVGGLGIYFVRRFVDAMRYRHEAGRNIIELDMKTSAADDEDHDEET